MPSYWSRWRSVMIAGFSLTIASCLRLDPRPLQTSRSLTTVTASVCQRLALPTNHLPRIPIGDLRRPTDVRSAALTK
jgi:hypothetical protein